MNQNLTQREWLRRAVPSDSAKATTDREAGAPRAGRCAALPDGAALVQTFEVAKERLVKEILDVSGEMPNAAKHQNYLLTLKVDVLRERLEILKREHLTTDRHR